MAAHLTIWQTTTSISDVQDDHHTVNALAEAAAHSQAAALRSSLAGPHRTLRGCTPHRSLYTLRTKVHSKMTSLRTKRETKQFGRRCVDDLLCG